MSEIPIDSAESSHHPVSPPQDNLETTTSEPSFAENFLNSFFQEKNIKWMLVVGAAIVFGSSLMLVTKAWPSWTPVLKYLTILGYTAAIFCIAEVGRKRLRLTATYKVLHSLTLLLLPVSFLALTWLSPGTGMQGAWRTAELFGLLIPATAFLWFAASRILDHQLRGRQSTFLFSYCLLCIAGALPSFSTAVPAFIFMSLCWLIVTAGIMKVNRHTFWLAEEHQLPRIFGFLPIAMLGLQFVVLTGTKAVTAIPGQWLGFGVVMLAATVLMTARTVADVFRQRTGDLVRPLPWAIVVSLFSGMVLTVIGLAISFHGFRYVGPTTYAVIPTALVAAGLMSVAAKDTRHSGFVWAGLICLTIAYQCSPTLFAGVVESLKQTTAQAINRPRVPFSLYGVTYVPLLSVLALASRWFAKRELSEFSQPIKHFVTLVAAGLFSVAAATVFQDAVPLFWVSAVNVATFLTFAVLFGDRRYVIPSLLALVVATGTAIPALNSMHYANISTEWVPTVLAGLAALMTVSRVPDRMLNTIVVAQSSILRHRDPDTNRLTSHSLLLQSKDGANRYLSQTFGCVLAALLSVQWTLDAAISFSQPLGDALMFQYGFLMAAMVLYTLRNPHYLSGLCIWSMLGFAGVRWAVGMHLPPGTLLNAATIITAVASLFGYLMLRQQGLISETATLNDIRKQLGFDGKSTRLVRITGPVPGSWTRRTLGFVVPLIDLSLVVLSCLAAFVHSLLLARTHLMFLDQPASAAGSLLLSTTITVWWLAAAAIVFRSRDAMIVPTAVLPLWVTAVIASLQLPVPVTWFPVAWAVIAGIVAVTSSYLRSRAATSTYLPVIAQASTLWLQGLLLFSCVSFNLSMRIVALICLAAFLLIDRPTLSRSRFWFMAIMANVQLLLLAAAFGGCSGLVVSVFVTSEAFATAVPFVFLTSAISIVVFDKGSERFDPVLARVWAGLLRSVTVLLIGVSLFATDYGSALLMVTTAGFVVLAAAEVAEAIRRQSEGHTWSACAVAAMCTWFLFVHDIITLGAGISQFVLLGLSITGLSLAWLADRRDNLAIIRRPMTLIGHALPALVAILALLRQSGSLAESNTALNALALMIAASIYFQQAMVLRLRRFAVMAAIIMNCGLMLLWRSLHLNELEFYLVPIGLSVLGFVELLKKELPHRAHDPLRYIGAFTILVSPVFDVLGGSWGHMFTLMVLSVLVILTAIGLRIRVLVYAGSAFLLADLVAMVVRSTVNHPSLLWVGGVLLGAAVIALAAFCENHREKLLSRIRVLSAELASWE